MIPLSSQQKIAALTETDCPRDLWGRPLATDHWVRQAGYILPGM